MADRNKSSAPSGTFPAAGWNPSFLIDANQQALKCWARAISTLTEELGQFAQARLQEDLGIWSKLTTCKDVSQVFECQRQFVQKATSDYIDEANKLSRLTMNIANEGLPAFQTAEREPEKVKA